MNYITGKSISRRRMLRGTGTALALPLLNAMFPAGIVHAKSAPKQVKRLSYVFMPMGCDHTRWTPQGNTLDNLPFILKSLAPVSSDINVISNLELANAYPGSHATSNSAFLSCAKAKHTESSDYRLGTTADQIAAQQIGQSTKLPSMELSMDLMQVVGQCSDFTKNNSTCPVKGFVLDWISCGKCLATNPSITQPFAALENDG